MKHLGSLSATYRRIRADGWTSERRVTFCVNLASSKSVTFAAASGLSRKAAYALKKRDPGFAALWQSALSATKPAPPEGDTAKARGTINEPHFKGNNSVRARRLAEAERNLFFAALGKTSARRIVAEANRRALLPTEAKSPTLIVSKSA